MTKQKPNICVALLETASFVLALWIVAFPGKTVSAASNGSIAGVVTDDVGKPIRGAAVTVNLDKMSVPRDHLARLPVHCR